METGDEVVEHQEDFNSHNTRRLSQAEMVETLKKRSVPVEYILFPDEGHGWRQLPNRARSTVAIVNFFNERLNR